MSETVEVFRLRVARGNQSGNGRRGDPMTTPERGRDGLREAIEALAVGALIEWAGESADLDDCREAAALVAQRFVAAGVQFAEHPATGDEERGCRECGPGCLGHAATPPASDVDSDNAAAGGAEGLAEVIQRGLRKCRVEDAPNPLIRDNDLHHATHMVTAEVSGWLAAHDAKIRAEALREAADALDLPGSDASGYYASEAVGGYQEAEQHVETWLRVRADRIEGTR